MPMHFQCKFSDAQTQALSAAAVITDPRTGLTTRLSLQQVVLSIVDQWIAEHAEVVSTPDNREAPERVPLRSSDDSPTLSAPPTSPSTVQPQGAAAAMGGPRSDRQALADRVRELRKTMGHDAITRLFNREQIPTFSGKPGARWSNSSIERLAKYRA